MAGRCVLLCLCTALAIAAAAGPADGVRQSRGQQVSDDRRPELVDWPHFGKTPNAFLVSDRLGVETSAGNSYSPVKSSTFQVSNDFKRPKQVIDPKRYKRMRRRTTTTTTVHPFLKVYPKQSWEDKWPHLKAHNFWVEGPDKKTLKKIEKFIKKENKIIKERKKKKKEAEKKKKAEQKRKKPTTTPKPVRKPMHPWRNNRNLRQLIRRTAVAETETSRIRDVKVPSGLHEWSQQQLNRVQQSRTHRRSRLPQVLPSADSNSHVH